MLEKVRHRYLALKIDSKEIFGSREFMDAVWNAVLKLYGEYGMSRSGLMLINYDAEKRLATIRTMHTTVEIIRAALASITKIQDKPVAIHVLTISGTIRTLHKRIKQ